MAERRIRITAGSVAADAVLNGTATATAVWEALPLAAPGETWDDEIYFERTRTRNDCPEGESQ